MWEASQVSYTPRRFCREKRVALHAGGDPIDDCPRRLQRAQYWGRAAARGAALDASGWMVRTSSHVATPWQGVEGDDMPEDAKGALAQGIEDLAVAVEEGPLRISLVAPASTWDTLGCGSNFSQSAHSPVRATSPVDQPPATSPPFPFPSELTACGRASPLSALRRLVRFPINALTPRPRPGKRHKATMRKTLIGMQTERRGGSAHQACMRGSPHRHGRGRQTGRHVSRAAGKAGQECMASREQASWSHRPAGPEAEGYGEEDAEQ
jgi:hypothetical protein